MLKKLGLSAIILIGFSSCDPTKEITPQEIANAEQKIILQHYVDDVVINTYNKLADASMQLKEAINTLKENKSQENLQIACNKWKEARKYWEQSEAFLFGAAADYEIDPHIDSWPLDKVQLDKLLSTDMDDFDTEYALNNLNGGLLGFHALEYVLFREGQARTFSDITDKELIYAVGVAGDLSLQTARLEASWAGLDNVSKEKQALLEKYEKEPTQNYGEIMVLAGEAGSIYKTPKAAIEEILSGAIKISDEVGNTKIADPVKSQNVLDVESWYSWNSLDDFVNNIISVQNAYLCGVEGARVKGFSVSAYIHKKDAKLDEEILKAIDNAIKEIKAIGQPFRNHLNETDTKKAIEACNQLKNQLEKAKEIL